MAEVPTDNDTRVLRAFVNFLSWQLVPAVDERHCPPAIWAYMWGITKWCPPAGEW